MRYLSVIAGMFFTLAALPCAAEENLPVTLTADTMHYDQKAKVVSAEGDVVAVQGGKTLHTDVITYNQNNDKITAEGNVILEDISGDTYYADDVELTNNMDDGAINRFEARLADKSLLQAERATRKNGVHIKLKKARYTACPVCKKMQPINPIWQIRADDVHMDKKNESITYKNAFFDVYGVPVLYTPYMSHPTPGAKRRSGILTPTYGSDSLLGYTLKVPYYLNIAPNMDATISPIYTSKEGMVMTGEYRHLLSNGSYELKGSITRPDRLDDTGRPIGGERTRGHIEGKGAFKINKEWGWGFVGKRTSDDTYLRRYHFGEEDTLTSRVYAEKIRERNYVLLQTLSFQGLNAEDDPGKTPFIFPYAQTHYESAPGFKGSRWVMDTDALVLSRSEGMQSRHVSTKGGWRLPHTTKSGHVFLFEASMRGDMYSLDQKRAAITDPQLDSSFENRLVPQLELDWSFPLLRQSENNRIILEPVLNLIASPYGGNPVAIPNEDSQVLELSDINLFSDNRFTGVDRLETGPRANYGIRGSVHGNDGQHVNFLFGQSYRLKEDSNLSAFSGLNDNASDYVGRVGLMTNEVFDLGYRFRLDKEDFSFRRHELMAGVNVRPVRFDVDYISLDAGSSTLSDVDREELFGQVSWDIDERWALSTNARRDLTTGGGFISSGATVFYKGDCVTLATSWMREFTRDRDIEPSTTISFQILLKNLN